MNKIFDRVLMLQKMFSRFVIVALAAKQVIGMFENGSEKK